MVTAVVKVTTFEPWKSTFLSILESVVLRGFSVEFESNFVVCVDIGIIFEIMPIKVSRCTTVGVVQHPHVAK